MGKSKRKNNWKDKQQKGKKKQNTTQEKEYYSTDRLVMENKSFEAYYKVRQKIRLDLINFFSSP